MSSFIEEGIVRPFGPLLGRYRIPPQLVSSLNALVDESDAEKLKDHGDKLAGQIAQELIISPETVRELGIDDYLLRIVSNYVHQATNKRLTTFKLTGVWVVRQKAHEYNPIHCHAGHISGAGWFKVPDGMMEGGVKFKDKDGCIVFTHGSHQFTSPASLRVEPVAGLFTVFPHYLMHHVYPFAVDGERRTLSFNAEIDDDIFNVYE